MALAYDGAIQRLIDAFAGLPGIGPKGAQRIAFYLLSASDEETGKLVDAITEVKEKVRFCDICGNVCEVSPCPVCADPRLHRSTPRPQRDLRGRRAEGRDEHRAHP